MAEVREIMTEVIGWDPASALLEFTEGPAHFLRGFADTGITNITSPALDIAALCLSS